MSRITSHNCTAEQQAQTTNAPPNTGTSEGSPGTGGRISDATHKVNIIQKPLTQNASVTDARMSRSI